MHTVPTRMQAMVRPTAIGDVFEVLVGGAFSPPSATPRPGYWASADEATAELGITAATVSG